MHEQTPDARPAPHDPVAVHPMTVPSEEIPDAGAPGDASTEAADPVTVPAADSAPEHDPAAASSATAPAGPTPELDPADASSATAAGSTPAPELDPAAAPAPAGPPPELDPADAPAAVGSTGLTASAPAPSTGALAWVDADDAAAPRPAPAFVVSGTTLRSGDLLAGGRRRRLRPATIVPPALLLMLVAAYVAATLLWPLDAVAPRVRTVVAQPIAAAPADPAWPAQGEAAIALDGMPETLSTAADAPESIASITKVVTALLVLDKLPLAPGEQGGSYAFTQADSADYWQYRARGESSLDVPVDGSLTQLQMLQGMLIASANNYAQRLSNELFGSDAAYAAAAAEYLSQRGIDGVTIVNPTGIEAGNTATPAALISLAERALANPVIAEIVRTPELTLPGAGTFRNGNSLLEDPGVVGVKTGTLDAWNLLTAKDITVGGTTVRAYASVLGQPGPDTRDQAARDLFARIEEELQPSPSLTAGTVVGKVETLWGPDIDAVTAADATVVLWNGAEANTSTAFDLGDRREAGETVGSLTATGPVDADTVEVRLTDDIEPPSPWWRLTHPLDLFGLNG